MSLAIIKSRALNGLSAPPVAVEVHVSGGLPGMTLVGLPETEVKESRDRVRAALLNAGFTMPASRITVNLAPADLPKESGRFDLPIALGILVASGQIRADLIDAHEYAGELSLSGELRPIRGALAMAYAVSKSAPADQLPAFVLPTASAHEAALVPGVRVLAAQTLGQVVAALAGLEPLPRIAHTPPASLLHYADLFEVKGQEQAKRALEIAAAGQHSLLMVGPPGTGKSMLAQRLPGLLPPMTIDQALESAAVLNLAGRFDSAGFGQRQVRQVHNSASGPALIGGGSNPRPGEISLAHEGVLFLDELPEFDRRVLESLREPLETGRITVSRAARQTDFPARFQLVAAMNPCPCGYLGHRTRACRCSPDGIAKYRAKLSGPLLDRIDISIEVPAVPESELMSASTGEASPTVAARVLNAHSQQQDRQGTTNARLTAAQIDQHCATDATAQTLLRSAMEKLGWSARAYHRVLKVARTIADLQQANVISATHVAEAIQLRRAVVQG